MTLGIRSKLFLLAVGLSLLVLLPAGLYLDRELRSTLVGRIERELEAHLRAAVALFQHAGGDRETVDRLADQLGADLDCRITVIAPEGTVLGDSEVPFAALATLDNHASRPEVALALAAGRGSSRRHSVTTGTDWLYLAAARPMVGGEVGVVRVARRLDEIAAALARMRWILAIAATLSLVASILFSAAAAHLVSRTMGELVARARAMAEDGAEPVHRDRQAAATSVEELALERARSAAVLEGMSEGVIALDRHGAVKLINGAAQEMLGAGGDAVGRTFLEVVRVPALDDLVASGAPGTAELDLPATRRRVSARLAVQTSGGAVLVLHDVTAIHRLETVRRDFVANVSHELRTPVSVISANAETLLTGALSDSGTAPRLIDAIHRNARRLTDLIDDLLDLSRLEAGSYRIERERVQILGAVQRAVEQLERVAERRRTPIAVDIDPALVVSADAGALHQVLVNVITNAIVHTPEDSRVAVRATPADDRMRIDVADDGPGVPAVHRGRIFERFYRIDPGRSRDMGGTGLGLSIVKHLIDAMGGRVTLRDNQPRGTIVSIELPRFAVDG